MPLDLDEDRRWRHAAAARLRRAQAVEDVLDISGRSPRPKGDRWLMLAIYGGSVAITCFTLYSFYRFGVLVRRWVDGYVFG